MVPKPPNLLFASKTVARAVGHSGDRTTLLLPAVCVACWIVLTGCGAPEQYPTAPVTGSVVYNGKSVAQGQIRFHPSSGPMAMGKVIDGQYRLETSQGIEGAVVGRHTVTITAVDVVYDKDAPSFDPPPAADPSEINRLRRAHEEKYASGIRWVVPIEYSDAKTSELTADVSEGKNIIDFKIDKK